MDSSNRRPIDHWQELPYPGERPDYSWRRVGDFVHRITPVGDTWSDESTGETLELRDRVFILAYGSNASPGKLRGIDAVMLQAEITDAKAVWCEARRREGSVVSTLVAVPGCVEVCSVLAITPEELPTVDGWELPAYRRVEFWGQCTLENGITVTPEVYIGGPRRKPLRLSGDYLGLHKFDHAFVDRRVS